MLASHVQWHHVFIVVFVVLFLLRNEGIQCNSWINPFLFHGLSGILVTMRIYVADVGPFFFTCIYMITCIYIYIFNYDVIN